MDPRPGLVRQLGVLAPAMPRSAFEWDQQGGDVAKTLDGENPEFRRGWEAALLAARYWHEDKAKQTLVQERRSRFPKTLEREAEVHRLSAEMMGTLAPEDF